MHKNQLVSDKELISLYSELKSCKKVAKIAWKTKNASAVHKRLKDLNVNTSIKGRTIKTFLISDQEMANMYLSGKTLREIAEVAESSKGLMSVRKRLQSLGVNTAYDGSKYSLKLSKAFKKYELDETVFDIIDTEEKAYWLGFLMADGYNHES